MKRRPDILTPELEADYREFLAYVDEFASRLPEAGETVIAEAERAPECLSGAGNHIVQVHEKVGFGADDVTLGINELRDVPHANLSASAPADVNVKPAPQTIDPATSVAKGF